MSLDSTQLQELELLIADRIYIQVENWHLYLGDAGLSKPLAIECQAHLDNGANIAARKACEGVQVLLGGGNTKLPLSRLISSGQFFELEEILQNYCP
ncbi:MULTISPECIES: DUF3181 family protein [Prochlorococcus]|uniref:DUF3181 domain-containing protein n=1 Tax=Prochlorococcus marinus (strain SARG / CCMP1375 / SS120) TaxID=167539 RepID=Q7VDS6_PROMA|nr:MULTISPECIES: DUF3181 family protein [Prochlorococcus]AAP99338.1 Uncharacterized protein Pro_0292 [Prochlorococcus marinus subsp. marinus str. CCMP1375]